MKYSSASVVLDLEENQQIEQSIFVFSQVDLSISAARSESEVLKNLKNSSREKLRVTACYP